MMLPTATTNSCDAHYPEKEKNTYQEMIYNRDATTSTLRNNDDFKKKHAKLNVV
jgi:hypothetical protein